MPATVDLVERSGDLKRDLLTFARGPRFGRALQRALAERFGRVVVGDDGELFNFLDHFILQRRQADGRTVVEHFVEEHPELPEAERAMLLGWREVVEGIFAVQGRDGVALIVENLIDELPYRVRSNMGPGVFAQMPVGSYMIGRLVPVGDEWLISGATSVLAATRRAEAYSAAANIAARMPSLVFRNPAKVERGWELQREEHRQFIDFFGADLIVLPGHELGERMRDYARYRLYDARDEQGRSAAERAEDLYGVAPPVVDFELPEEFRKAETVAVIYDEVEGMNFYLDFGRVEEAFANPDLAGGIGHRRHRKAVLTYLEDPSISPLPLRRLAARDPDRASRVFQQVLRQRDFSWERDGEALLRRYKASHFEAPVLPSVTRLSDRLSRAQIAEKTGGLDAGHRPGRNEPCPCGSGRKYKHCCGR